MYCGLGDILCGTYIRLAVHPMVVDRLWSGVKWMIKMGKLLFFFCFMITCIDTVRAQRADDLGAGVVLGNPTGVTAKLWVSESRALAAGLGISTNITLYMDHVWHSWTVLPQPAEGRLSVYVGPGMQIRARPTDEFSLRAVMGVAYWLPHRPVELFLELVPVLRCFPGGSVGLDGGVGFRLYFGHV